MKKQAWWIVSLILESQTCGGQPAGWLGALAPRVSLPPLLLPLLLLLLLLYLSLLTVASAWLAAAALFLGTLGPVVFNASVVVLAASIRLAFCLKNTQS